MRNNSDIKRSRKLRIAEITQKISELTRELEEILQLDSSAITRSLIFRLGIR
jgi:hypothetical protein